MYSTRVLVLLAMLVGFAHCFSWDIFVGGEKQLNFYSNGALTHTEEIPAATRIASVTYDPVRYRLLFTDESPQYMTISSYDLKTGKIQPVISRKSTETHACIIVYDPVTQLLFMKDGINIYSYSLNPVYANKADDGNLLVAAPYYVRDIAVDSCGGYIYWITDNNIEKARFDGSQREVIINSAVTFRLSLTIDQQTQKMYWIDHRNENSVYLMSIESADFNGNNRKRLYIIASLASSLAVSKDFIYWQEHTNDGTWQLPKNAAEQVPKKLYTLRPGIACWPCQHVAANYTMQEQIQGIKSCEAVQDLFLNNSKSESTISVCQNFCLEGDCGVSAEGQPTCSCNAGYTGKRCEVNACHKHCLHDGVCSLNEEDEPICECTAGYEGQRCDVAITQISDCAVNSTQQVLQDLRSGVSCNAGYTGKRCKVNACHKHCLHDGVCSLNEEDEPICECTAGYEGQRCDVAITQVSDCAVNSTQQVLQDLRSGVRQVFQEELKRILQLFSDKLDEDQAKCSV